VAHAQRVGRNRPVKVQDILENRSRQLRHRLLGLVPPKKELCAQGHTFLWSGFTHKVYDRQLNLHPEQAQRQSFHNPHLRPYVRILLF